MHKSSYECDKQTFINTTITKIKNKMFTVCFF